MAEILHPTVQHFQTNVFVYGSSECEHIQNTVNQPKPLLSIKETCLLETQASSQKLMGLLLGLSVMSALSSEIDCKFQTLSLKTN